MSLQDYRRALEHSRADEPFYGLVMGAMLRADNENFLRLKRAFPDVRAELQARYDAPGGILPGEPNGSEVGREAY
jgi:hypothetical protein